MNKNDWIKYLAVSLILTTVTHILAYFIYLNYLK